MENSAEKYLQYVTSVRRYSPRTRQIYSDVISCFAEFAQCEPSEAMKPNMIRGYEVYLLGDRKMDPRTVNLHLSVLSGYAKFLIKEGAISSNPVSVVSRPKVEKRLPVFYRDESMKIYFDSTLSDASVENLSLLVPVSEGKMDKTTEELYRKRLSRVIISTLASTGMRR
ncbi:MAG: phage integrase N-terminal SAM-like domain-containing protein, partial [Bacteroidales bacterium]|nr:phage integrase N-terminal SAM-like domain-containing protein [Bacteroidales bacterium]